jgi:hypothetical protein
MSADLYRQVRKAEDIAIAASPIQQGKNQAPALSQPSKATFFLEKG